MKVLFEHMATELMLIMILFVLSVFTVVDTQVLAARRVHSSVIDQMQASYYTVDIDSVNESLHDDFPNWTINVEQIDSYGTRKEYKVELVYDIEVPLFGITKNASIVGYVR